MADGSAPIGGASLDKIATNGSNIARALAQLSTTLSTLLPFSGSFSSFTCAAAATTTVTDVNVAINSIILLMPTNAAAGTLQGSAKSLYVSARTAGVSFAVATASAGNAAGTETFSYIIINPSA